MMDALAGTRAAFAIALDAAVRDQARATAAVEYLREKLAALPEPVQVFDLPLDGLAILEAPTKPRGRAGGGPTKCPDCGKAMGSVAGMAAHRRSRHAGAAPAPTIASRLASEAERIREVAADIRAREPAVVAEVDAFVARREEVARARASAAWAENHPVSV